MTSESIKPEFEGLDPELTHRDEVISSLQESLTAERDARREDRFMFIVVSVLLLDIVFFSVMSTLGGPLALLVLELLILIPLARWMGMNEIVQILSRILDRVTDQNSWNFGRTAIHEPEQTQIKKSSE